MAKFSFKLGANDRLAGAPRFDLILIRNLRLPVRMCDGRALPCDRSRKHLAFVAIDLGMIKSGLLMHNSAVFADTESTRQGSGVSRHTCAGTKSSSTCRCAPARTQPSCGAAT
jgi:hypothetical protein